MPQIPPLVDNKVLRPAETVLALSRGCRIHLEPAYHVDESKFKRRFWSDVTPFEIGAPATAQSFSTTVGEVRPSGKFVHN